MEIATSKEALDYLVLRHESSRLMRGAIETAAAAVLAATLPDLGRAFSNEAHAVAHNIKDIDWSVLAWYVPVMTPIVGSAALIAYHGIRGILDGVNNLVEAATHAVTPAQAEVTYRRGFTVRPGPFDRIAGKKTRPVERFSDMHLDARQLYFINGVLFGKTDDAVGDFLTRLAAVTQYDASPVPIRNRPILNPLLKLKLLNKPDPLGEHWALFLPAKTMRDKEYLRLVDWGPVIYTDAIKGYRRKETVREPRTDLKWVPAESSGSPR